MTRARRPGRPIWQSYADTGALAADCPTCTAPPGTWCSRPDGRVRRTPCLARITRSTPVAHDFGEPRHPQPERNPQ